MSDSKTIQTYWDNQPCNIRHSSKPIGTREYWDEVESRKYRVESHIPAFADFQRWHGKKVLEIGCGLGTDAVNFARHGAHYTGMDLSGRSVELARKRFDVYGLKGRFVHCDVADLPELVPFAEYDLIYSFGVIHHMENPAAAVQIIRGYMGMDSEFRLMVYAQNSWKSILVDAGLSQWEAQANCPKVETYTAEDAVKLLAGLKILEMRQDHLFPYQIPDYVKYNYVREAWFNAMPDRLFRALEKRLGCHLLIRCCDPSKQT